MESMFNVVEKGPHGDTIYLPKSQVKIRAYKSAHYIVNVLGRTHTMTFHADESVTVGGDGLEPCTYTEYPKDN